MAEKVLEINTSNYKREIDAISASVDALSDKIDELSNKTKKSEQEQENAITSMKDWKARIDELKASMMTMDRSSQEYASTLAQVQQCRISLMR